jgi:hypothetical protein
MRSEDKAYALLLVALAVFGFIVAVTLYSALF